jgi:peptidoglycan hydrolase CwlO-like protein
MVKKLVMLVLTIMTSSYAFSQNATTTIEYINIPVPTVKKITIDLLRGDSALAQLDLSNRMIVELQSKTVLQDNIISNYEKKEQNYLGIVTELEKKVSVYQTELKNTQKELRKVKAKRTFGKIISGVIIGGLTYLYITK